MYLTFFIYLFIHKRYDPQSWEMAGDTTNCPYNSLMPYTPQTLKPVDNNDNNDKDKNIIGMDTGRRIYWTYSVHWEHSESVKWKDRWDPYMASGSESQIHLVSILNSAIIVLFLVVVTGSIVQRTSLSGNTGVAISISGDDVVGDEVAFALPLSVLIGSGAQVLAIFIISMGNLLII